MHILLTRKPSPVLGLSSRQMFTEFRGKGTYQAELDIHFPTLTMRETMEFAFKARTPPSDWEFCHTAVESEAETLGLAAALDTKMGNALLPGASGGERKGTSIAVCSSFHRRHL